MKRISLFFMGLTISGFLFAGGIVTNTNQSAAWTRMLVRDASVDIDATFFNPAGLTKLSDGFHLSLSNQTISQTRTISNDLLNKEYEGTTFAPVFPSIYAAYKTGKFAFSFGFNGIGGGGTAEFADGVPLVELGISQLPAMMASLGATGGYAFNSNISGSSIYFGYQAGVTYEINDMISVYAGGRYVMANNAYEGQISDVAIETAGDPLTNASVTAMGDATQGGGDAMQPLIDGGAGTLTFAQAEGAGAIDATQRAQMEGGLLALGVPQASIDAMDIATAQGTYYGAATSMYTAAAALADQMLDAKQSGSGFTPIVGLNLSLMEDKLNIGVKYEFKTELVLTNETASDVMVGVDGSGNPVTMFPDGAEVNADMPAMLSIGVGYKISDAFYATAGFHHYADTKVGWENVDDIESGLIEYGLGLEYAVTEQLRLSTGWLGTKTGVKESYQSDLSYSLSTNTFGFGGAFRVSEMIDINLGGYYVLYADQTVNYTVYNQTYDKSTWAIGVGVDFTFGAGK